MLWVFILILLLRFPKPIQAQQIPLTYQLLQAYQPSSLYSPPSSSLAYFSLKDSGKVLGTSTQKLSPVPTPTPTIPKYVGGEGDMVTVAVLGDSMIDTLKPGIPQLVSALQKYYPNKKFNVLNYGTGGSNIEYGLYRLKNNFEYLGTKYSSLISQNPDIVVIESFAYNNFGNSQEGIDRHWLTLGAMVSLIKTELPQTKIILAATIAPNSVTFGNGIPNSNFTAIEKIEKSSTIKLYLQNTINFATSQNYPLANAYYPSLVNNEGNPNFINPSDHLHPSVQGGQFFCDILAQTIFTHQLIN